MLAKIAYSLSDLVNLPLEKRFAHQNRFLDRIPRKMKRRGGTNTALEWAYTIGLMQAVCHQAAGAGDVHVLDVGCGTGRLALALSPLLGKGRYVGIDVKREDIELADSIWRRRRADDPDIRFVHLQHSNRKYAPGQGTDYPRYPFEDGSFNLVTALSVWTHLNEADATFYLKEIARVLRSGGKAVMTFFILDEGYREFLKDRPARNPFSKRPPSIHVFDLPVDGVEDWRCPSWCKAPEEMIGVTTAGLDRLLAASGLRLDAIHRGNWRSQPGLFYQDVLVFSKP